MTKPMLGPDEAEVGTWGANHIEGRRMRRGHLMLTDRRMIFYPTAFDKVLDAGTWECPLTSVVSLTIGRRFADGSIRRRLQLQREGATDFFVTNNDSVIAAFDGSPIGNPTHHNHDSCRV